MNCPPEIVRTILEIMQLGILACRVSGWNNDAKRAALEADHIHNLPSLLLNFSRHKLEWYWEAERASYIEAHLKLGNERTGFESLLERLKVADPTLKSEEEIAADFQRLAAKQAAEDAAETSK